MSPHREAERAQKDPASLSHQCGVFPFKAVPKKKPPRGGQVQGGIFAGLEQISETPVQRRANAMDVRFNLRSRGATSLIGLCIVLHLIQIGEAVL
jgi:hypothetical protein